MIDEAAGPAGPSAATYIPSDTDGAPARVEGTTREQGNHANPRRDERETPRGTGGEARKRTVELPWDIPLKLDAVRARFVSMTAARLKSSTQAQYWNAFAAFAIESRLEALTKKDLSGRKGQQLLISFAAKQGAASLPIIMAGVKKVWRKGLELPWPVESDDLPRPAAPRIVEGPRTKDVEPWARAIRNETDQYLKAWFAMEISYGLRPLNQQGSLRRKHVKFGEVTGKPIGLVANGRDAGFKTDSYLIAAFSEEIAGIVSAWIEVHPDPSPDALLFPYKGKKHTAETLWRMRRRFVKKWGLKWITSKTFRHFVKGILNDVGMPEPAKSAWQGHRPKMSDMAVRYGARPIDDTFDLQLSRLPDGVLGIFDLVTSQGRIPLEVERLWLAYEAGEIEADDVARSFKDLKRATRNLVRP